MGDFFMGLATATTIWIVILAKLLPDRTDLQKQNMIRYDSVTGKSERAIRCDKPVYGGDK